MNIGEFSYMFKDKIVGFAWQHLLLFFAAIIGVMHILPESHSKHSVMNGEIKKLRCGYAVLENALEGIWCGLTYL